MHAPGLSRISGKLPIIKHYIPEISILLTALLMHFYNLSGFPSYFIDEGSYIDRALTFRATGDPTAPAGTFYFHPFLVWVLLGLLFAISGFPGLWRSSPQLLYLLPRSIFAAVGVGDAFLLYYVTLRAYKRRDYALLASALLAVTPLSVRYLRMVLLDSFMVFFLLLSLAILVRSRSRRSVILSGGVFGLAMLSKAPAAFFIIPLALLVLSKSNARLSIPVGENTRRLLELVLWALPAALVAAIWPLYAVVTGQLAGLQAALRYESSRQQSLAIDLIVSRIIERDVFLFAGIGGIVYGIIKRDVIGALFTIAYLGTFVLAGLRVSSYYLVPVLPFLSILASRLVVDAFEFVSKTLSKHSISLPKVSLPGISLLLVAVLAGASFSLANQPATADQVHAMTYLIEHAPPGALIISSPAYSWLIRESRTDLTAYDWFQAPWKSLPPSPSKTFLIVDPGFSTALSEVPNLQYVYNQTSIELLSSSQSNFPVEVRSTLWPLRLP